MDADDLPDEDGDTGCRWSMAGWMGMRIRDATQHLAWMRLVGVQVCGDAEDAWRGHFVYKKLFHNRRQNFASEA